MASLDILLVRNYLKHTFDVDTEGYDLQFKFEGVTVLVVQVCKDSRSETERLNTKEFRIPNTEYRRWKKIMGRSGKLKKIMEKNGQRFIG